MKSHLISMTVIAIIFVIRLPQNLIAEKFKETRATVPLEVLIQNSDAPQATILNMKDTVPLGHKLVSPNQLFALMFNPENPNEPIAIVDIKKTILKYVFQHPEILQHSKITARDLALAGFSEEEKKVLLNEPITSAEKSLLATIIGDFILGDYTLGHRYCMNGCWEIIAGTAKIGMGFSILIKKALSGIYNFTHKICAETIRLYQEA
jgi:hypothetical protein